MSDAKDTVFEYRVLRNLGGSHEIIAYCEADGSWMFQWPPMVETDTVAKLSDEIDKLKTAFAKPVIAYEQLQHGDSNDGQSTLQEAGKQEERLCSEHILKEIVRWIDDIDKQDVSADIWRDEMRWLCRDIQEILTHQITEDNSLVPPALKPQG